MSTKLRPLFLPVQQGVVKLADVLNYHTGIVIGS